MIEKLPRYLMYVLIVVAVIVFFIGVQQENYDPMIYYSYVLFGLTAGLALLAAIMAAIMKPQTIKGAVIGVVGLGAVLGISYGLADDKVAPKFAETLTPTVSKLAGAGLYAFYILFALAIISIVFSSVVKSLR
jgi:sugar phosphate permease